MKNSSSGLLSNLKSNYFASSPGFGDFSSSIFHNSEKASTLQFELDRIRDSIMKLRTELYNKTKEITLLKVQKNKKDNEHQHIVKVVDDILKQCDQSTSTGFKAIETYLNSINPKLNDSEQSLLKDDERLEDIKKMIHLNEEQFNTLNEIVQINRLKTEIIKLSDELNKKENDIFRMKKNRNNPNYNKLKINFVKNFNELRQIKRQNEIIRKRMEEASNMLIVKKEDNINLKNKLHEYQKRFKDYKEESSKRTESLSRNLLQAQEKERNCRIFHTRKNTANSSNIFFNSSNMIGNNSANLVTNEENSKSNLNVTDIKLNEAEQEMKKLSTNLNTLKKEANQKMKEINSLKFEKLELKKQIKELSSENNKYLNKINAINKQILDINNTNTNFDKENTELKKNIEDIEFKVEEEENKYKTLKEILNEKDNEILELKKTIENIKKQNKDNIFFTSIGAIGKKKDEVVDTDKNLEEEFDKIDNQFEKGLITGELSMQNNK